MSASSPSASLSTKTEGASLDRLAARLEPPFPLRLLGFGLVYAWSTCLWDTEALAAVTGGPTGSPSPTWFLSAVITPVAFLLFALLGRKRDLLASRALAVAGPALAAVGTLLVVLAPHLSGAVGAAAVALGAVCTGIGPVALILLWINLFARLDMELVESAVPASFAATLAIALFVPNMNGVLSLAAICLLPIASGALYLLSRRSYLQGQIPSGDATTVASGSAEGQTGTIARMFALLLVSYSIGCLLRGVQPVGVAPALSEPWTASIGMLFAIALAVAIVLFSRRIDLDSLYRWITAPFALAIILAAFPNSVSLSLSSVLGNATFTGLEIIMIIYFIRLANRTGKTPTLLLGLGECAAYTGVFIGYGGGTFLEGAIVGGALDPKTASLVLVGAFICSTLLVPRRDLAWSHATLAQPAALREEGATEGRAAGVGIGTPAGAGANAGASTSVSVSAGPAATDRSTAPGEPAAESFDARCARIARERGLSARETEIFRLLAQGRSQPYIRDLLYLSKNTVSTHTRHIYRKLDVHSKQELLDVIEEQTD